MNVNGLNRFKSGFIVDNFDLDIELVMYYMNYNVTFIDMENREVRPKLLPMKVDEVSRKVTADVRQNNGWISKDW